MLQIRKATEGDLEDIRKIYNEAVENTTATFDTEPRSSEDRLNWFRNRDEDFPVVVALKGGQVVGYASLSRWSDKKAYDVMAEISLYIWPDYRGMGIGKRLLEYICAEAQQTNLVSILARITEGNERSVYLHKMQGFEVVGVLRKAGNKFGRLLDVTLMQKMLN